MATSSVGASIRSRQNQTDGIILRQFVANAIYRSVFSLKGPCDLQRVFSSYEFENLLHIIQQLTEIL